MRSERVEREDDAVTAERLGYRPELDALRAVACLAVFVFHAHPTWLPGGGWVGVTAFFTLSGYLITSLLLAERERSGTVDVVAFYGRRARRLLPALVLLLAVALVAGWLTGDRTASAVPWAFYGGNLRSDFDMGFLTHTWTLAVEEHFYLAWPVVFLAVWRFAPRRLLAVTVALAATSMMWRLHLRFDGASWERLQRGTDVRAESLLIGCAAAMIPGRLKVPWVLFAAGLVPFFWITTPVGYTAVSLLTVALIAAWGTHAPAVPRVMTWFGRRTYGFYLWHVPVLWFASIHGLGTVEAFALSTALAALSWLVVERRWLRGRHLPDVQHPHHQRIVGGREQIPATGIHLDVGT